MHAVAPRPMGPTQGTAVYLHNESPTTKTSLPTAHAHMQTHLSLSIKGPSAERGDKLTSHVTQLVVNGCVSGPFKSEYKE